MFPFSLNVWNTKARIWNSCVNVRHLLSSAVYCVYIVHIHHARIEYTQFYGSVVIVMIYMFCCVRAYVCWCAHEMREIKRKSKNIPIRLLTTTQRSRTKTPVEVLAVVPATTTNNNNNNSNSYKVVKHIYCTYFAEKYTLKTNCCNKYPVCDT